MYSMVLLKKTFSIKLIFTFVLFLSLFTNLRAEEGLTEIKNELIKITQDLKTLEKAFYKTSEIQSTKISPNKLNEDVLTRHLLKLNEIEEQFQEMTNKYEEVNFKIDRLSNRITKMQTDNQMRLNDLEAEGLKSLLQKKKDSLVLICHKISEGYQIQI